MTDKVIATDHPLTAAQQQTLAALVDTILPGSADGRLPSARQLDFIGHLNDKEPAFVPLLIQIVDDFDDEFSMLSLADRYPLVEDFSRRQPQWFKDLLLRLYDCYYTDEGVKQSIGVGQGAPFPRGNTVKAGDLTLLDPVVAKPRTYRK